MGALKATYSCEHYALQKVQPALNVWLLALHSYRTAQRIPEDSVKCLET